jgi:hypothetical protein
MDAVGSPCKIVERHFEKNPQSHARIQWRQSGSVIENRYARASRRQQNTRKISNPSSRRKSGR